MGKHGKNSNASGTGKNRCPAMIEADILLPDSHEGIKFCLNCPYPDCIAFSGNSDDMKNLRWDAAKELRDSGHTIAEIAEMLNIKEITAKQYISRKIL